MLKPVEIWEVTNINFTFLILKRHCYKSMNFADSATKLHRKIPNFFPENAKISQNKCKKCTLCNFLLIQEIYWPIQETGTFSLYLIQSVFWRYSVYMWNSICIWDIQSVSRRLPYNMGDGSERYLYMFFTIWTNRKRANNMFIFFPCSKLVLQITNGFVYATLVIESACAPSTNDL